MADLEEEKLSDVSTSVDSEPDTQTADVENTDNDTKDDARISENGILLFVKQHILALVGISLAILHIICGAIFRGSIPPEGLEVDILTESLKVFALYVGSLLCDLSLILGLAGIGFNIMNVKFKTKLCAVFNTVLVCLSVFLLIAASMVSK